MRAPNYRQLKKQREESKRREQQQRLAKRQPVKPAGEGQEPEPKDPAAP